MAEARRRFGDDMEQWKFVCPACGHVASVADWRAAGAPEGAIAFSCIGRYLPGDFDWFRKTKPCNYTLGGLFKMATGIQVNLDGKPEDFFNFAPSENAVQS